MLKLCFTFDYELFFGKNYGTYDEVLFHHTYNLIDKLEELGVTATFFADVCSIPMAQMYQQDEYVDGFKKQIQYMMMHRQDVQLHLHPHWFHANMQGGQWEFTNKGYRLHDFSECGRKEKIIDDGIRFLNDTLREVKSDYACTAFRAGGFSIQPHNEIVGLLYDKGIRIDSSVAPFLSTSNHAQYYDYRHKLAQMNWNISEHAEWWKNCSDGKHLLEIPVATIDKSLIPFLCRRLFKPHTIKLDLGAKRGTYISSTKPHENWLKTLYKYFTCYNAVSLDAYAAEYLYTQVKRMSCCCNCKDQVVAIIGHPKLVTDVYIRNMERFIKMIQADSRFEIVSICQIGKEGK